MSTHGSAQRNPQHATPADTGAEEALPPFELKQQVAERLASHRARRTRLEPVPNGADAEEGMPRRRQGRAAHVAAAVAERYSHVPSYRTLLAAEAERAVRQAEAAAEMANITAQAIAVAQQRLLAEFEDWHLPEDELEVEQGGPVAMPEAAFARAASAGSTAVAEPPPSVREISAPHFSVRLYEEVGGSRPSAEARRSSRRERDPEWDAIESLLLDEEIAFRQAPTFGPPPSTPEPIAANLIEFPRQLIAARKARPRRAEGPLLDDGESAPGTSSQLRIFEVEADQISKAPATEAMTPEWTSILLSSHPARVSEEGPEEFSPSLVPQTAPMRLRMMSAAVDACLVGISWLAFAASAVALIRRFAGPEAALTLPRGLAAAAGGGTLALFAVLYQVLFFCLSDGTPGMRFARIGLCTFADENPTRSAMRRRILAMLLSAGTLGIGYLWAWLDEDGLGWHDRISRMYQRAY